MKKNIALFAGGYTGESVISMKSAGMIENNIDTTQYNVYKIILTDNSWYYESNNVKTEIDKNDFSLTIEGKKIKFDLVFIIIHGSPGEDGKLQGYFDMLNIPYTTCDSTTSAITMNKGYTKSIVNGIHDLHTAGSLQIFQGDQLVTDQLKEKLKLPYFVKPNNGGSSIGMSKVVRTEDLPSAIDKAFKEDKQILVEEFIKGREFTIGVVKLNGKIQVLPMTEIISSKEFFDYEAKYTPGITQEITPGRVDEHQKKKIENIVIEVYKKLNCKGVVRIDFILQENTDDFYFIEINTVPGQSENSIIPQQVRAMGKTIKDFYSELIEEALR
jgi:D-alanine-D-alanine ligase